jgi:triacylglycerol lipase
MGPFGVHWRGWREVLEADGFEVFEHMPTPVATSTQRADELLRTVQSVKRRTGAQKVIVIAHSQGGLDARLALSRGGAPHIAAVATLSSPHGGTPLADAALALFPPSLVQVTLAGLQRVWQVENDQPFSSPQSHAAIASLSARAPAVAVTSEGAVPFFSLGAVAGDDVDGACEAAPIRAPTQAATVLPWTAIPRALIATQRETSNDGVVPTRSMRHGHFLGCVAGDHAVWLGWTPNAPFDHRAFALVLAQGLDAVAQAADASRMERYVPALRTLAEPANHMSATAHSTMIGAKLRSDL